MRHFMLTAEKFAYPGDATTLSQVPHVYYHDKRQIPTANNKTMHKITEACRHFNIRANNKKNNFNE